jgi:hypothetical protein
MQFSPRFNANLKIIRRIGQLEFGDFLASVFPRQMTMPMPATRPRADPAMALRTGDWRATSPPGGRRGSSGRRFFEDLIDIIPIATMGGAPAHPAGASLCDRLEQQPFELDPLGLKGARDQPARPAADQPCAGSADR